MSILCLGASEDKFESSQEESREESIEEDDLSLEDNEGRKFWNIIAFGIVYLILITADPCLGSRTLSP